MTTLRALALISISFVSSAQLLEGSFLSSFCSSSLASYFASPNKPINPREVVKNALQYLPPELLSIIVAYARPNLTSDARYKHALQLPARLIRLSDGRLLAFGYDNKDGRNIWAMHQIKEKQFCKLEAEELAPTILTKNSEPHHSLICIIALPNQHLLVTQKNHIIKYIFPATLASCPEISHVKYNGHTRKVNCLAVLSNGNFVSGSDDKSIKEWDVNYDQSIATYRGHSDAITSLAVLSNGNFISGSTDKTIFEWTPKNYKPVAMYKDSAQITCVAVLNDGSFLSGSSDGIIKHWKSKSEQAITIHKGHSKAITQLTVLEDDKFLSGSLDGTVKQWNSRSENPLGTYSVSKTDSALSILVNPNGTFYVSIGDEYINKYNTELRSDLEIAIDTYYKPKSSPSAHNLVQKNKS